MPQIEKIDPDSIRSGTASLVAQDLARRVVPKLNELIDAVNALQGHEDEEADQSPSEEKIAAPEPSQAPPEALNDRIAKALATAGYDAERIRAASDEELGEIPGIGEASIAKIRDAYPGEK